MDLKRFSSAFYLWCMQTYVHRVGRTGRAGQAGAAITIFTPADSVLRVELEEQLGGQPASTSGTDGGAAAQPSWHVHGVTSQKKMKLAQRAQM